VRNVGTWELLEIFMLSQRKASAIVLFAVPVWAMRKSRVGKIDSQSLRRKKRRRGRLNNLTCFGNPEISINWACYFHMCNRVPECAEKKVEAALKEIKKDDE